MIRLILVLAFTTSLVAKTFSQDTPRSCNPDTAFLNSTLIISPTPFINDTLGDGIPVEACINMPYDLTFFVRAPKQISALGLLLDLNSIRIDSVSNLPEGLSITCSTPDCIVQADSIACVYLTGTPTASNDTGSYALRIGLTLNTTALPIPLLFPDTALNIRGSYTLRLNEEGSPNCTTTPVFDQSLKPYSHSVYPNPAQDVVHLEWENNQPGNGLLQLWDYTGQLLQNETIILREGLQEAPINLTAVQPGIYFVGLQSDKTRFWSKVVKNE